MSLPKYFGRTVQPDVTHSELVQTILIFRHEERLKGKQREQPYNAAQQTCKAMFSLFSQRQLRQLQKAANHIVAKESQWRFLRHYLAICNKAFRFLAFVWWKHREVTI